MEILRTEAAQVTAPSGQQILRVRFCGEGGECVTVEVAHVHGVENTEAAFSRARAILVQTATFGLAANEYDARSSGNFDEVAVSLGDNIAIAAPPWRDGMQRALLHAQ